MKEESAANGSTAPADPNATPALSSEPLVNGTSAVTAPSLDVSMSEPHADPHGHEGTATKEHESHPHETHVHVNSVDALSHGTPDMSGHHDPHLIGITDTALIDAVNLLNESAQDITLESGSIHPVSTPSQSSVPGTPAAPSTAAIDPAPTTTAASANNAAPTSTTPAQPSTAAPQTAVPQAVTPQPNGVAVAPGTVVNPVTGEVKEKKKVFNRLWTPEEQRKLERLLEEYPEEIIASHRWEKIARALGNRSPKQASLAAHSIAQLTGVKMSL